MNKKKIMSCFLVFAIIFMALAMSGCTDTEDEETIEPNAEMSVLDAELRATDSYDLTPDSGNVYLYLQVEIESLNEEEDLSLNPFSFELETDAGSMYRYNDQVDAPDNLSPDSTSVFWISFEIPENETGEKLHYEPSWYQDEAFTDTIPTYSNEVLKPKKLASLSVLDAELRATDSYDLTPDTGNVFLYLQVKVDSLNEEEELSLNPIYFELETDKESMYNYNDQIDAPDNLSPGSTSQFWISFEIPEDETGGTLYYEPSWLQDEPYTDSVPTYSTEPPRLASLSVLDAEIRDTDTYGLTPGSGNVYLYLKAKVTNKKDEGDISIYGFDFEIETATGGKYSYNDQEDAPDKITAGNSATFWISFEIPQDDTGDILHYEPSWGDTYQADVPSY